MRERETEVFGLWVCSLDCFILYFLPSRGEEFIMMAQNSMRKNKRQRLHCISNRALHSNCPEDVFVRFSSSFDRLLLFVLASVGHPFPKFFFLGETVHFIYKPFTFPADINNVAPPALCSTEEFI